MSFTEKYFHQVRPSQHLLTDDEYTRFVVAKAMLGAFAVRTEFALPSPRLSMISRELELEVKSFEDLIEARKKSCRQGLRTQFKEPDPLDLERLA